MVPVRAAGGPVVKAVDDHIGPVLPDDAHHIREHEVFVPDPEGFVGVLRIAEINGPGKKLLSSVYAPGRQEFLRAQYAEEFAKLGADQVLPPVAPGHRKIGCARVHGIGKIGDKPGIFVIRVSGDVERRAQEVQFLKVVVQPDGRGVLGGLSVNGKRQ